MNVVYLELHKRGLYLDSPTDVRTYTLMFDHLRSQAADTAADNECVEVAVTAAGPSVRDSKAPALGTLTLAASSFSAFVNSLAMDGVR